MSHRNIHHLFPNLEGARIILASQSPRRQQLLAELGIRFEVLVKPDIDESFPIGLSTVDVPVYLAKHKAANYQTELAQTNTIVITADTIVAVDGTILGKPGHRNEAIDMLKLLSGKIHDVVTGVAVTSQQKQVAFAATTSVRFKHLSIDEIAHYVDAYKPFDKAGGYGIQEWIGLIGIEKVEGSYYNVVGLPTQKLYEALKGF